MENEFLEIGEEGSAEEIMDMQISASRNVSNVYISRKVKPEEQIFTGES